MPLHQEVKYECTVVPVWAQIIFVKYFVISISSQSSSFYVCRKPKLFTVPNGLGPNLLSLLLKVYSMAGNHSKIVNQSSHSRYSWHCKTFQFDPCFQYFLRRCFEINFVMLCNILYYFAFFLSPCSAIFCSLIFRPYTQCTLSTFSKTSPDSFSA